MLTAGMRAVILITLASATVSLPAARAAEPAPPTKPEPTKEQHEHSERLGQNALALANQGKTSQAIEAGKVMLTFDRQVYGDQSEDVRNDLAWLGNQEFGRRGFAAAGKFQEESLQITEKLYGKDDWRTTDSRLYLEDVHRWAKLTDDQRKQLDHARDLLERAQQLSQAGKHADALALAEESSQICSRILGPEHHYTAIAIEWRGLINQAARDFAPAERLLRNALEIDKKVRGPQHPDYARILHNLATLYHDEGDYARAEPVFREALEVTKKALGPQHPNYAASLNNLAGLYKDQGAYARAESLDLEALEIYKRALGPQHPNYAASLQNLATLYEVQGDYARAEPLYLEVLEIYKKALGPQHPNYVASLDNLAILYEAKGDYPRAEAHYREAVEVMKKIVGPQHPDYAKSLNNLAAFYRAKGEFARAEALFRETLETYKRALGTQHSDYALTLNNLATVYQDQGDYARAEPLYREALEIQKKAFGPQHPDYAASLNNLAGLYEDNGDYTRAETLYREALEIRRKALGSQHPDYAASLNNLAGLHRDQGTYARAEPLNREALKIYKRALGPQHPNYAASLHNLATLYQDQGDYARAEPLYREALEIVTKTFGPQHPNYASSLNNLAGLYEAKGDYSRAEALDREVLEIYKNALGPQHPAYAIGLGNLSACKLDVLSADEAIPLAREAARIAREHLEHTATIQSERQQLAMAEKNRWYLELILSASRAAKARADEAYDQVLAWKGAVTDRQGFLRAMRRDLKDRPETLMLYTKLQDVTGQLGVAMNLVPPEPQRAAHRQRVEQLSQKVEDLQQKLAGASARFSDKLRQRRCTAAELRQALPDSAVLVDLVEYTDLGVSAKKQREPLDQRRLAAFVLRRDRPAVSIDLGPVEPVAQAVDVWRARQIGRPESDTSAARRLDVTLATWKTNQTDADPGIKLRNWIWDKLPAEVRDPQQTSTVLVSPDGALARFPWAALPGHNEGSYLIEEQRIAVIPVARELPELLARQSELDTPASLLLVGSVDYGGDPGVLLASDRGEPAVRDGKEVWPRLKNTLVEVATIEQRFQKRFVGAKIEKLEEKEAIKQAVRELAPKFRYLHFATHGFFADPDVQPLTVRKNRPLAEAYRDQTRMKVLGHHPGLLSGIVLTGANRPPADGKDDGILTALEVGEMDLSGVDLVTLSACETGLGATAGGEGLLGLQRALQTAGARTTVATLWKVRDDAAQQLMSEMYDNLWTKRMSKLEALRQAQLSILYNGLKRAGEQPGQATRGGVKLLPDAPANDQRRLPPYYWAAFVLSGDWR